MGRYVARPLLQLIVFLWSTLLIFAMSPTAAGAPQDRDWSAMPAAD